MSKYSEGLFVTCCGKHRREAKRRQRFERRTFRRTSLRKWTEASDEHRTLAYTEFLRWCGSRLGHRLACRKKEYDDLMGNP